MHVRSVSETPSESRSTSSSIDQLLRTPPPHPIKSSSSMTLQDNHLRSCIYRPEELCLIRYADDKNSRLEKGSRCLIGGNFEF